MTRPLQMIRATATNVSFRMLGLIGLSLLPVLVRGRRCCGGEKVCRESVGEAGDERIGSLGEIDRAREFLAQLVEPLLAALLVRLLAGVVGLDVGELLEDLARAGKRALVLSGSLARCRAELDHAAQIHQ